MKEITQNGMTVKWHYENERIHFEMSAPTYGWVTIGFNKTNGTTDAYLIMGNVEMGTTNIVEHYTISPGNYKPLSAFKVNASLENIRGTEKGETTTLNFSLPIKSNSKYQKDLSPGLEYIMILAYSREDDFQHHSTKRTSVKIKL